MAVTTSQIHAFMNALIDGLDGVAALDGVQLATVPLGKDTAPESIQLVDVPRADQDWYAIGKLSRVESFDVNGGIYVRKPGAGDGVGRDVRARLFELFSQVETYLRNNPAIAGQGVGAQIRSYPIRQGADPDGRWAEMVFTIQVGRKLPT